MGISHENWPAAVALFTGIFAKETVVGTLDALYTEINSTNRLPEQAKSFDFRGGIKDAFIAIPVGFSELFNSKADSKDSPDNVKGETTMLMSHYFDGRVGAFAYLLFVLIYAPCVATIAAIYREASWRWALFSVCYLTTLAWVLSTAFYQLGTIARHPAGSLMWLGICAAILGGVFAALKLGSRSRVSCEE
jgi:ferrous iron transport protein B